MRNARAFVVAVAIAAALVSTYPLLLGRSVASPLLGGVALLYRDAPYTPGNPSTTLENPRAVDMLAPLAEAVPYLAMQRAAFTAGEWPHWNRYSALGTPLHGQGQPSPLDPLHLLALTPRNPAAGLDLKIVVGRVIFATGAALLGHAIAGVRAGVVLGVVAPFIGLFLARLAHPAQFSIVYVPWLLLGYVTLSRHGKPRIGAAMLVWVASALTLVGSPAKEAVAQLAVAHAVGMLMLVLSLRRAALRTLTVIAIGLVLVAFLTAPHWLIFLDTLNRAQTLYDQPTITFAGWTDALGLVLGPVMPGTPMASLNIVAAILAVLALLTHRRSGHPAMLWAVAAICILGLIGGLGLIPESWLLRVPGVGRLQRVGSLAFTASLVPLLMLAAHVDSIRARARVVMASGIVIVFCAIASWRLNALLSASPGMAMFAAVSVIVAAVALLLAGAQSRVVRDVAIALAAIVVLLPGGLHLPTRIGDVDRLLMQPPPRPDYTQASTAIRDWRRKMHDPMRTAGIDGMLRGGSQALYGIEGILEQDALVLPGLNQLMERLPIEWHRNSWDRRLHSHDLGPLDPILNLLGVNLLLLPPESNLGEPVPGEPMRTLTRSAAWPRAFFVSAVRSHADTATFVQAVSATRGPFASIRSTDAQAAQLAGALLTNASSSHLSASSYHLSANRTAFRVTASSPGIAVLMESWVAHDFQARVNGQVVPYFRVNEVGKAVVIPSAGEWAVTFDYRPRWWAMSWWMALVGALGMAVLVGTQIRRASRAGQ